MVAMSGEVERGGTAPANRAAGLVYVATGLGFGLGAVATMLYFARNGELPMTPFGFRSLAGPFESQGDGWFTVLGWSFVVTCATEVLAGLRIWRGQRRGAA